MEPRWALSQFMSLKIRGSMNFIWFGNIVRRIPKTPKLWKSSSGQHYDELLLPGWTQCLMWWRLVSLSISGSLTLLAFFWSRMQTSTEKNMMKIPNPATTAPVIKSWSTERGQKGGREGVITFAIKNHLLPHQIFGNIRVKCVDHLFWTSYNVLIDGIFDTF